MSDSIADNIARVRERIAAATARAGRGADEVTLLGVTKLKPAEAARRAVAAGLTELGENYAQEAAGKRAEMGDSRAHWHLIGHLQSNKAKLAVQTFDLIQSVDSVRLAHLLGRHALALGKTQPVLLQAHLGDEATKSGLPPEQVLDAAAEVAGVPGLRLQGLMGIAPAGMDPRPHFRALRRLFEALPADDRAILSLGMTGDFEAAIEEGSTMVRIGTAIFGPRG